MDSQKSVIYRFTWTAGVSGGGGGSWLGGRNIAGVAGLTGLYGACDFVGRQGDVFFVYVPTHMQTQNNTCKLHSLSCVFISLPSNIITCPAHSTSPCALQPYLQYPLLIPFHTSVQFPIQPRSLFYLPFSVFLYNNLTHILAHLLLYLMFLYLIPSHYGPYLTSSPF